MLRLIITAVLASACLAYPQRREGAPAEAANLQGFDQAMPNMQGMGLQPMQAMPGMGAGQMLPFNPNFGLGFKRAFDENLGKRREHSEFVDANKSPFESEESPENFMDFMNFMKDNGNSLPFANMDNDAPDLDNFQPSAENEDSKFNFFDQQQ